MIRSSLPHSFFTVHPSSARVSSGWGSTPAQTVTVKRRFVPATTEWNGSVPIDVYASEDTAVVLAALPGIHPDSLDVTVNEDIVTISGTIPGNREERPSKDNGFTWYVSEIGRGTLRRSVQLPFAVDVEQVEAHYANGMLRLTLPRHASTRPHRVSVQMVPPTASAELTAGEEETFSAD